MAGCECCDNFSMIDGGDEFKAFPGLKGDDGTTFYPHVSADGVLSWTNDGGKPNPDPVNIKGTDGKSAYEAAVEAGFTGTESEFNEYLSNIGVLTDEVADQKSALDDLTDLVDRKAGMLVDTASGAIASFVPDSTIDNLLGVTVDVEPVQDLHGYDSPWPGGGGVNKLPPISQKSGTANGVTFAANGDGTYTITGGTSSSSATIDLAFDTPVSFDAATYYVSLFNPAAPGTVGFYAVDSNGANLWDTTLGTANKAFTNTAIGNTPIAKLRIYVAPNVTFTAPLTISPVVATGAYASAWSPYENLCPISGWSAVEIDVTGENLLEPSTLINASLNVNDGTVNTGSSNRLCVYKLPVPENSTITASVQRPYQIASACFYDAQGNYISSEVTANWQYDQYTYNIPSGAHFFTVTVREANNANLSTSDVQLKIEIGSTSTEHKPYSGNTYTIALGQTVYGCRLTIDEDGSVTALVDRKTVTLDGSQKVLASQANRFFVNISEAKQIDSTNQYTDASVMCDKARPTTWSGLGSSATVGTDFCCAPLYGNGVGFRWDSITTAADWKAYFTNNPTQFSYEIATPIEIPLDPVTISAISSQTNNVWSDAGDVSVTYAADIKTYIDQKIAAAVAALS